jgi:hypothetical protein
VNECGKIVSGMCLSIGNMYCEYKYGTLCTKGCFHGAIISLFFVIITYLDLLQKYSTIT